MHSHQDPAIRPCAAWLSAPHPAPHPDTGDLLSPLPNRDELLTPKEAAAELRVHHLTLKNWRSTGFYDLPYIKMGSKVYYRREVIEDAKLNGLKKAKSTPEKEASPQ